MGGEFQIQIKSTLLNGTPFHQDWTYRVPRGGYWGGPDWAGNSWINSDYMHTNPSTGEIYYQDPFTGEITHNFFDQPAALNASGKESEVDKACRIHDLNYYLAEQAGPPNQVMSL